MNHELFYAVEAAGCGIEQAEQELAACLGVEGMADAAAVRAELRELGDRVAELLRQAKRLEVVRIEGE